jgi:hypothetical protein
MSSPQRVVIPPLSDGELTAQVVATALGPRRRGHIELVITGNPGLTHLPALASWVPRFSGFRTALTALDLSHNNLRSCEEGDPAPLATLRLLNLAGNQLTVLPHWVNSLRSLRILNVSDNRLHAIDPALLHLRKLTHFHIENNPLTQHLSLPGPTAPAALITQILQLTAAAPVPTSGSSPALPTSTSNSAAQVRRTNVSRVEFVMTDLEGLDVLYFSEDPAASVVHLSRPFFGPTKLAGIRINPSCPLALELRQLLRTAVAAEQLVQFFDREPLPSYHAGFIDGKTLLHYVASSPNLAPVTRMEMIHLLLARSPCLIDICDLNFCTALHMSGQIGCFATFWQLLEAGFTLTCQNRFGETPLHNLLFASQTPPTVDDCGWLTRILNHPTAAAALQIVDLKGETPLFCCRQPDLLAFCLQQAACQQTLRSCCNHLLESPFEALQRKAGLRGDIAIDQCLTLLGQTFPASVPAAASDLLLEQWFRACANGTTARLCEIQEVDPEIWQRYHSSGLNGFHLAILNQRLPAVRFLLRQHPPFLEMVTVDRRTPLHCALKLGPIRSLAC